MTIYQTLLTRGYFPKELPPAFFTEQFARYATTRNGRRVLASYKPLDNFTECVKYGLALPGLDRRELKMSNPTSFATMANLIAEHFGRLLKKASSGFSKSRPVFAVGQYRAIHPMMKPQNLAKERAALRAGASFLLRGDVSQFYPSLYTHAVGWAIDPNARNRANWHNGRYLGRRIDQALMNSDAKVSQGIPIGNDLSFLLAEVVLAQVDKALKVKRDRAFRWFDDYEIAFDTREEAEACLKKLNHSLATYRLRLNPRKTGIVPLPQAAQLEWQEVLTASLKNNLADARDMARFFDTAFRLREQFPDLAVLSYALGLLFSVKCPTPESGRIAQSCITQSLLCEAGVAQKAFSLLSFWDINGFGLDATLITDTINQMIYRHQAGGLNSDVAWALAFCLEKRIELSKKASRVLSVFDDDCTALQCLHLDAEGLLPAGYSTKPISRLLKGIHLDREHWLLGYESVRQGFLRDSEKAVKDHPVFSDLLAHDIAFYRQKLPSYAIVVHQGGAPEWVIRRWIRDLRGPVNDRRAKEMEALPLLQLIEQDFPKLTNPKASTTEDIVEELLDVLDPKDYLDLLEDTSYPS